MATRHRAAFAAAAAVLAATLSTHAVAQSDYPNRPTVIVLAIGAGSGTDLGLRLYADRLSKRMGQSFVVENKPGASTILGTEYGKNQTPNGYNLTSLFSTSTIVPSTHKVVPFDPVKDFMPIAKMAASEYGMAVTPSLPVKNLQELIAYAKANPGKLTYASPGHGTPHHLGFELFKLQNGLDILHVPHKSISDALNTVQGGHTQMILSVAAGLVPIVQSGRMRMIGVTGSGGLPALPDVRTMDSQGAGYLDVVRGWFGLAAPLKTPQYVITRLNQEINAIAKSPDFIAEMAKTGGVPTGGTPEDLTTLMKHELETWAKVVKEAKVELQ
jgi:tripartite-type tricarboxylate transporter receptor subunit TctC